MLQNITNAAAARFWKDANWTSVKNIRSGLTTEKYLERLCAFGPNLINIREKPTMKLLRDEVQRRMMDRDITA